MTDGLISKQALLYALDDTALTDDGGVDVNDLDDLIKRMPTIEAEPIKRGRWEFNGYYISELSGIIQVKCSKCGFKTLANGLDDYNYCPNCGAKMDEVEE